METTINERLRRLEDELHELKHHVLALRPPQKDWLSTVGMMPDDALSRSAEQLGREWRAQANQDGA